LLDLFRRDGRPLVVGHRGAAAVAPENTLAAFRAGVAAGADVLELDVLALEGGPLVVAHSAELGELTHGRVRGAFAGWSLEELRTVAPDVPTFEETLAWFADEAPGVGVHVDLKLRTRLDELASQLERHGLAERTVVSSVDAASLRAIGRVSPRVRLGLTYPHDRLGVSRRRYTWPLVHASTSALRAALPPRLPRMLRVAGAGALMLQHRLVSGAAVVRAHAAGTPVLAWTVDDPEDARRVVAAGVDGVITNDPGRLLATLAP
jgi:glycerophosphoryl diester phosphodiesterase